MAVTGFFHHIGTFLLFSATILLIITDISSPVVHNIAILKVNLGNSSGDHHSAVTFGTFGHCLLDARSGTNSDNVDFCSRSQVGYSPAEVMTETDGTDFSQYATDTTRALTKVMILHPIATGISFIAFMLALGAGMVGSFLAALVALLAFLTTVVVLITDFVLFSIIKSNVNDDNSDSQAFYSVAMWTLLVSAICNLLGTIVVFFTCCSARLHRRRDRHTKGEVMPPPPATRRRRWF